MLLITIVLLLSLHIGAGIYEAERDRYGPGYMADKGLLVSMKTTAEHLLQMVSGSDRWILYEIDDMLRRIPPVYTVGDLKMFYKKMKYMAADLKVQDRDRTTWYQINDFKKLLKQFCQFAHDQLKKSMPDNCWLDRLEPRGNSLKAEYSRLYNFLTTYWEDAIA